MPSAHTDADDATQDVNREYYLALSPGRADYWRRMAAPRFRIARILSLIAERRPSSLVDLGCGGGELIDEIGRAYPDVALCGIDLSKRQIEANRQRDRSVDWRAIDLDGDEEELHELRHRFDAIVAAEVIEHVKRPERFLANALKLAKPGVGRIILSTQSGRIWPTELRVGHHRHFSADGMRAMLMEAGWKPLCVWNEGFPFHDLSKRLANISPERTMQSFSGKSYSLPQKAVCWILRALFHLNSRKRGAQLFAVAQSGVRA